MFFAEEAALTVWSSSGSIVDCTDDFSYLTLCPTWAEAGSAVPGCPKVALGMVPLFSYLPVAMSKNQITT